MAIKQIIECDICRRVNSDDKSFDEKIFKQFSLHVCPDCVSTFYKMVDVLGREARRTYKKINDTIYLVIHFINRIDWENDGVRLHFGEIADEIQEYKKNDK